MYKQIIINVAEHETRVALLEDGTIAGWAHVVLVEQFLAARYADLKGLIVGERWRGRGIGEAVLGYVESWAVEHGCTQVLVRSNVVRERAHQFYLRLGYIEKKRQVILIKRLD